MPKEVSLGENILPIREFDLAWMCENPSICMIAKRGSGKSWICRSILKHFSYLPGGLIIAPTDKMSCFYGKFFPDIYIHYEYSNEILERMFERQSRMIDKCVAKYMQKKKVDPRAFIIMDDCLSSKGNWMSEQPILEIFYNGRHFQLMFILTMQFPLGIKPELRANFDYIFLLADDFYSNQKRLFDHYAGMFPSLESFRQVFTQITDDYGAMVIVNRGARKNILDKVFYFKAENEKIDKIGGTQFNQFYKKNYDRNWRNKKRNINMNSLAATNKNKPKIVVEKV